MRPMSASRPAFNAGSHPWLGPLSLSLLPLGVFHLVLLGARMRVGSLPLEYFMIGWLATLAALIPQTRLRQDAITWFSLALIVGEIIVAIFQTMHYGDFPIDRTYYEIHRITPVVGFLVLYSNREALARAGGRELIMRLVLCGIALHVGATLISLVSDGAREAVLLLRRVYDAASDRAVGGFANVYRTSTGQVTYRVSGLMGYATNNAAFIAALGVLSLLEFSRSQRRAFAIGFGACVIAVLATYSRAAALALGVSFMVYLVLGLLDRESRRRFSTLAFAAIGFVALIGILSLLPSEMLRILTGRFTEMFTPDQFESGQAKANAMKELFSQIGNSSPEAWFRGDGVNNYYLLLRRLRSLASDEFVFVSNGWALIFKAFGILGLIFFMVTIVSVAAKSAVQDKRSLIATLPLLMLFGSDNYFVVPLEFYSFWWVFWGLLTVLLADGGVRSVAPALRRGRARPALRGV